MVLASNMFMMVTIYRDREMEEVDHGESAKVDDETTANLTEDDLSNGEILSDEKSTIARMMSSKILICDT